MSDFNNLLVQSIQDLLNAEHQIMDALPKMVEAAHCKKLKEGFERHLVQTEGHVERLKSVLNILGESPESKPCKGMKGILDEGEEIIRRTEKQDELTSDLALIAAGQKVEHYEIAGYKNAHCLAKQMDQHEVAKILEHTLGEEESTDYLLSALAKPLLQQASSVEVGNGTRAPWGEPGESSASKPFIRSGKKPAATSGSISRSKAHKAGA
jgi:Mn-containing catalase